MMPMEFLLLDEFCCHKLQLGKHDLYSFNQAMLSVPKEVRDHLLLHQVLSGLPDTGC